MNTILYMEIPGLPAYVKLSENAHTIPLPVALYGMKRPKRQAWPNS